MQPNTEQVKSAIRWFVATFGGMIVGWAAARGWDLSGILSVINPEALISLAATVIMLVWSMLSNSKVGIITAAAKIPEVKKVELAPTAPTEEAKAEVTRIAQATPPEVIAR